MQYLLVDSCTIGRLIFESPEIKAAYPVGAEGFCQLDAAFQYLVLLIESEIGIELVTLGTVLGFWSILIVHFKKRTGNVGDAQLVALQDAPRFLDFFGIEFEEVFIPHTAQLDPLHTEFPGGNLAGVAEILCDFVVDDCNFERRTHTVSPILSSRYFLEITADSLGVRDLSGTLSSSTTAHPRKLIFFSAAKTAGTSTLPRPNSTQR